MALFSKIRQAFGNKKASPTAPGGIGGAVASMGSKMKPATMKKAKKPIFNSRMMR